MLHQQCLHTRYSPPPTLLESPSCTYLLSKHACKQHMQVCCAVQQMFVVQTRRYTSNALTLQLSPPPPPPPEAVIAYMEASMLRLQHLMQVREGKGNGISRAKPDSPFFRFLLKLTDRAVECCSLSSPDPFLCFCQANKHTICIALQPRCNK